MQCVGNVNEAFEKCGVAHQKKLEMMETDDFSTFPFAVSFPQSPFGGSDVRDIPRHFSRDTHQCCHGSVESSFIIPVSYPRFVWGKRKPDSVTFGAVELKLSTVPAPSRTISIFPRPNRVLEGGTCLQHARLMYHCVLFMSVDFFLAYPTILFESIVLMDGTARNRGLV